MKIGKILKKGNLFVAYNEENEMMGTINIKTQKFTGNTDALIPLNAKLDNYLKDLKTDEVELTVKIKFADKSVKGQSAIDEIRRKVLDALVHEINCGNGIAPEDGETYTDTIEVESENGNADVHMFSLKR